MLLFLDMDGVLVTSRSLKRYGKSRPFDPIAAASMQKVLAQTDAKFVVSSNWRFVYRTVEAFDEMLTNEGFAKGSVVSMTPDLGRGIDGIERGDEIMAWLERNPVEVFAVVDDDNDMSRVPSESFFRTDISVGLTPAQSADIIAHLNKEST